MLDSLSHLETRSPIRVLSPGVVSRIQAGEVVSRPREVLKELVENALDAGAASISVVVSGDCLSLLQVTDDGCGIPENDLGVALERHATSKLPGDDISAVTSLGFRGEALASMASSGRVCINSRLPGGEAFRTESGWNGDIAPGRFAGLHGTEVTVRDLFSTIPARKAFQAAPATEWSAIRDVIGAIALSRPAVAFRLQRGDKVLCWPAASFRDRVAAITGSAFDAEARTVFWTENGVSVEGIVASPAVAGVRHGLMVNGRVVADGKLEAAVLAGVADLMPTASGARRARPPSFMLSISIDPQAVDINVHPRKAEVRFRRPDEVRRAVTAAIREAFLERRHAQPDLGIRARQAAAQALGPVDAADPERAPLGRALALFGSFVLSRTPQALIVVDFHAAHERVVFERMKRDIAATGLAATELDAPVRVGASAEQRLRLLAEPVRLARLGVFAREDEEDIVFDALPAMLPPEARRGFVEALVLLDDLDRAFEDQIGRLCAVHACHNALRTGDAFGLERADQLLREMEGEPASRFCIHGRPTAMELTDRSMAALFGR